MKPILFNTEMVRAILEGRKTVTRRVVKPQPEGRPVPMTKDSCWPGCFAIQGTEKVVRPPYQPGDILWVRETWQAVYETEWSKDKETGENIRERIANFDNISKVEAGISQECSSETMEPRMKYFVFKASDIKYADDNNALVWRPSIHMPQEAARIFLRVTGVRVERLQEITEDGAKAEGAEKSYPYTDPETGKTVFVLDEKGTYCSGFSQVWDRTIKQKDRLSCCWESTPWVWVIDFERISKEEAQTS